mmetsp:Transcript_11723/g.20134  ORF Transcript_11723/g.20134 Transcript_11723/m.20134 type:complete len:220 (+) Transcript_11723:127-786(+)|eukprot:CAMPEP_0184694776 /NCGR_PEP_ID=MMETSP0313-20130426/2631_1 /TAXON_ID=2792 /ORGANISM="Porphyridium aerugineum, Strain SAG 1380-2" /LENGTH=219 /DNA_ID=CAMNT_0027153123 /DNA_START=101 /DNA_END=760 /DNA_ORIENTATION=+
MSMLLRALSRPVSEVASQASELGDPNDPIFGDSSSTVQQSSQRPEKKGSHLVGNIFSMFNNDKNKARRSLNETQRSPSEQILDPNQLETQSLGGRNLSQSKTKDPNSAAHKQRLMNSNTQFVKEVSERLQAQRETIEKLTTQLKDAHQTQSDLLEKIGSYESIVTTLKSDKERLIQENAELHRKNQFLNLALSGLIGVAMVGISFWAVQFLHNEPDLDS